MRLGDPETRKLPAEERAAAVDAALSYLLFEPIDELTASTFYRCVAATCPEYEVRVSAFDRFFIRVTFKRPRSQHVFTEVRDLRSPF